MKGVTVMYFVFYFFYKDYDCNYYDSIVYNGDLKTVEDFSKLKSFIRARHKQKGRLVISKIVKI